jgi:LmbE family N-acetylglucosaminyl deacetylase
LRFLVVQPHLDDAFFSITETALTWVEDGHEVLLATVFAGIPSSIIDNERYWKHTTMWEEYHQALFQGPFEHLAAGLFFDDAARPDQPMLVDVQGFIAMQVNDCDPDVLVMPIGIHHPDHTIVRMSAPPLRRARRWYYDELPYFVMYPELAGPRLEHGGLMAREGCRNHLAEKRAICAAFASQMGETEERCLWAPERVWRPM